MVVVGLVAAPATASAGPGERLAEGTAQLTRTVEQATAPAKSTVRQTVEQTTARVAPIVHAAAGADPIRSAVDAVTTPVGRVPPRTGAAVAAIAGGLPGATDRSAPKADLRTGQADRAGGEIGNADRQAGATSARSFAASTPTLSAAQPIAAPVAVVADRPQSAASSTAAAAGDDRDRSFPPFGGDGGSNPLTGPVGIALVAIGLLVALLMLVPRFTTRLRQMTPGHRRPVAFLVPIERPG